MKTRRGTTTKTAKELTADAQSQYSTYSLNIRTVRNILREIGKLVDEHERGAKQRPQDWGYSGDMGKVVDDLMDIKEFLSGR
jgi:hypothetical protein